MIAARLALKAVNLLIGSKMLRIQVRVACANAPESVTLSGIGVL